MRPAVVLLALALPGCGSAAVAELPPPPDPAPGPVTAPLIGDDPRVAGDGEDLRVEDGRRIARLDARARVVRLLDARTKEVTASLPAGAGPTHIAVRGRWLFVVDTQGDGLLIARMGSDPQVVRRAYLPGRPYGIAVDARRFRLWVALSARGSLAELPSHGRARLLREVRVGGTPQRVAVAPDGRLVVAGPRGVTSLAVPPG